MQRQNVTILIKGTNEPICRGNFKKLCNEFDLPYHSLKMKNFPIILTDIVIHKVEFK